jgi:ribosomal protein S18 acetylase RimI-like enzyme
MAKAAPGELRLRAVTADDLRAVTHIHCAAFPASAITALGEEAARRYYLWQLEGPHDVTAFGAFHGIEMAGFYFGGVFQGALSGFLARERSYLAWRVVTHPWLVLNPLFRERLGMGLRVLRKKLWPKKPAAPARPAPENTRVRQFGILAIAVHPDFQGLGVGQALMAHAESAARAQLFPQMQLSVALSNQSGIRFYERLGWQRVFTRDHEWKGEMIKPLA